MTVNSYQLQPIAPQTMIVPRNEFDERGATMNYDKDGQSWTKYPSFLR